MGKTVTTYLIDGDPQGSQYVFISNKICQMFHLAQATVRAGLALLEKGGYVRVDPRTAPVVVYKAGPAGFRESAARYFVSRKAGSSRLGSVRKAAV